MENSYRFFKNVECKYYPCHTGLDEMNCLFCYCPFYFRGGECPGCPEFKELQDGSTIKVCTDCIFPHVPDNYDRIIQSLSGHKREQT